MYYVYVLKKMTSGKLYYGYTADLQRRVNEHKQKGDGDLVYYEAYKADVDARRRERKLKDYGNAITALKERLSESLK